MCDNCEKLTHAHCANITDNAIISNKKLYCNICTNNSKTINYECNLYYNNEDIKQTIFDLHLGYRCLERKNNIINSNFSYELENWSKKYTNLSNEYKTLILYWEKQLQYQFVNNNS